MARFVTLLMLLLAIASGTADAANETSLLERYGKKTSVPVHVAEPTGTAAGADLPGLRKALEEALAARKSITFRVTAGPDEAELRIDAEVTEYQYSDTDPIDMISGVAAAAYDAATNEHYVRLVARVTVTELKTQKALWKDLVVATITSNELTPETAPALVNADMAKVFIRNCFGKPAPRRRT